MSVQGGGGLFFAILLGFVFILPPSLLFSHTDHPPQTPVAPPGVGIDEKLGQALPLHLAFNDETGRPVTLKEVIHKPTIFTPVFYACPDVCNFLLSNLASALNRLPSTPGEDYLVLSVSFDETETPQLASEKKGLYLKMIERPFPETAWRFLTGEKENILRLTDAAGFHFRREGKNFLHPVAVIVLSPEGKITRYLYGTEILPFDLRMALLEASEGRTGPTIAKVLRFCFSYDPKGRRYVFNTLKITGIVTLTFALSFVLFLFWRGRKRRASKAD
ncbi:MAG: SCO family protein [Desulfobacterota bacterium]|nr:SCO family protein [Thermodesulfobacteriota bacterium]